MGKSESGLNEIATYLAEMKDPRMVEEFLEQILTESEVHDLSLRWESVKMIYQGLPQRRIAKELGISLCKITRGSRELKKENSAFRRILAQHLD